MELLEQIEAYLTRTRVRPSTFGRMAVGDPRFVDDLRAGRKPRSGTQDRVQRYLGRSACSRKNEETAVGDPAT